MMDVLVENNRRVRILKVMELAIKLGLTNNKNVYFYIPRVEEFSFDDDRSVTLYNLVSTISARKILRRSCQGYVALVRDTFVEGTCVENVSIVR